MAKDDYHVIVYQILSYLYSQLKKGERIDVNMFSCEALFGINEMYREYIILNLYEAGYIKNVSVNETKYIDGTIQTHITGLENCRITPRGIEYLTDNSFMEKAKEFFKDVKSIVPFI